MINTPSHPCLGDGNETIETAHGRELAGRHCSLDSVCQTARHNRLVWGLMELSNWCVSRAESDCDDRTTITMLERKTRELVISVDKAGWKAIADHVSANDQMIGGVALPETKGEI